MYFSKENSDDKLVEWLINSIKINYQDDVALVIHCNSLQAPGYENSPFPEFFIPSTEKGKELACSFIINGKKHDFYYRTWDYLESFENVTNYDTMIFADSKVIYARSEEDVIKYEDCKKKLFENLKNSDHMRQVAVSDYKWAVEIFKDCCLETTLSDIMMLGGYVCDLLVHSIASLNNRYIPQSFTNQYEFLESCKDKPEGFSGLYLKINRSRDAAEIKHLGLLIVDMMKKHLGVEEKNKKTIDANGLAAWYEEMIGDWARIRGFAKRNEPLNVRGWATKLQRSLNIASTEYGIEKYELLNKFDEKDMTAFFKYADWCELQIRKTLITNKAQLNEFATVDEFISAYERNEIRR